MNKRRSKILIRDAEVAALVGRWKIMRVKYRLLETTGYDVYHNCPPSTHYQDGLSEWHFANGRKCKSCRRRVPKAMKQLAEDLRALQRMAD